MEGGGHSAASTARVSLQPLEEEGVRLREVKGIKGSLTDVCLQHQHHELTSAFKSRDESQIRCVCTGFSLFFFTVIQLVLASGLRHTKCQ